MTIISNPLPQKKLKNRPLIMTMIKVYILFFSVFFAPAFANLESEVVYKNLHSKNPTERIDGLQSLTHTVDKTFHQAVVEMALLDKSLEVRAAAENTLEIFSLSTNDMSTSRFQRLRAGLLSVFPEEKMQTLQSIKSVENAPPLIQYTIIKEFVLKPIDKSVEKTLTLIATSDSYLQKWLMYVHMINGIPETVHITAKNILRNVKPSLDFQNETFRIATSDKTPQVAKKKAINILIEINLDWEFQKKLLLSISHKAPAKTQKVAKDILKQNSSIHLKTEQYLISIATSDEVSEITQGTAQDILIARSLQPKTQQRLLDILTTPGQASNKARNAAQHILTFNGFINEDIEQSLVNIVISDETPKAIKGRIIEVFSLQGLTLHTQQTLWNRAVSNQDSSASRKAAKLALIRTALDQKFEEKLLDTTTSPQSKRRERKIARAILIHNKLLHLGTIDKMSSLLRCRRAFHRGSL